MPNPLSRLFVFPIIKKIFNFRYSGLKRISKRENYIFAMNHQGGLDLFLALAVIVPYTRKNLSIIISHRAYDNPFLKPLLKRWQAIRIDHGNKKDKEKALYLAKKALDRGNNVLIFPEGEVIGGSIGEPTRAFTGVARLAIMSKKKVIPVGINGSFNAWKFPISVSSRVCSFSLKKMMNYKPKGKWVWFNDLYNFFEINFRHPIKMKFGKVVDLGSYYRLNIRKYNEENKRKLRIITTQLMTQIAQLAGQRYRYDC